MEMNEHITVEEILKGFDAGIVKVRKDEESMEDSVCYIGDSWFYFVDEGNQEEALKSWTKKDMAVAIANCLNDFEKNGLSYEEVVLNILTIRQFI